MNTLQYFLDKYKLQPDKMPVEIPNVGRDNLGEWFKELGFTVGAEIGTDKGEFAEILCNGNPGMRLYCVDAWKIYPPAYRDFKVQAELDAHCEKAQKRLKPYKVEIIKGFSMDVVDKFKDGELDFVYIDANHEYPFVTQDIIYWSRKVRSGGIIAGHDYIESKVKDSRNHVVGAVIGYTRAYKIWPWFLLGTKAKVEGQIRDNRRSWMWVKE